MEGGEIGDVYYTSRQNFAMTLSHSLAQQLWGLFLKFDWFVHEVVCLNVSITNLN